MKSLILLFAVLTSGYAAHAQESETPTQQESEELTISADRPGFSNGTGIVPRGHFQLEGGATASRMGAAREYSLGELLLRVPVSNRFEMRLALPSRIIAREGGVRETGFDDVTVETKILLSAKKRAAYALLLNAVLPTGSRNVAEHRFQPGATLAADFGLSKSLGLTLNGGVIRASEDGERFTQLFAASTFSFELSPKLGAFAEVYAFNQANGPTQKYFDGGITYLLTPRTQLDASAGVGLGNDVDGSDYFYSAGISHLF